MKPFNKTPLTKFANRLVYETDYSEFCAIIMRTLFISLDLRRNNTGLPMVVYQSKLSLVLQ